MKKSLFALAAMGAFAGAAQAQSSVTVYGILDVGYIGGAERLAGPTVNGNTVNKLNSSSFGSNAETTSRLGFRGTEDLGGGTRAFFNLETAVGVNSSTNLFGGTARAAFVGLGQKGIGQAAIGLQNTVVTDAISPTLTGQFNNIMGSVLFPGANIGGNTNATGALNRNSSNGNTDAFTFRTSNTLKVTSDRFAGIQASAMYVMNDTTSTQGNVTSPDVAGYTGGKNNANGWGVGLNYNFQKFTATAAYQSLKAVNAYAQTTAELALGTASPGSPAAFSSSTGAAGTNITDNQTYVGATYDFGILKAYAGWINRKATSQINANQFLKRSAQEIGVRGNFTKTIESWASVGTGRIQAFGNGEPTANILGWQVGSNYWLSKRTNLYAIYGQSSTSNASNGVNGATQSYNGNNYAVGVRHTF